MENLFLQNPIQPGNELFDRGIPEIFKLIELPNIRPIYYISNYGRVLSEAKGYTMDLLNDRGYLKIGLRYNDGKSRVIGVHRLVAIHFIPKTIEDIRLGREHVNHKNLIKCDNFVGNLEWVNEQENHNHAILNGAYEPKLKPIERLNNKAHSFSETRTVYGEDVGMSRLTNEQVHLICKALEDERSYDDCCIVAGLECTKYNRNVICNIKAGRRWQHISCQYNIKDTKELIDRTQYIIPICELLEQGFKIKYIVEKLQLPGTYDQARMFVSGIKNKKNFVDISKNYNF